MPEAADSAWYCYLLECADGTLYCGITNDPERRLAVHHEGSGAKYTRSRLPVKLAYLEHCAGKSEALRRERAIKALPRSGKLALCGLAAAAG